MSRPLSRRRITLVLLVALVLALATATASRAAIVVSNDNQGRTIRFDVRAPNVDTEWFAGVLRAAVHGDEISNLTIRIVPVAQISVVCGSDQAAACYSSQLRTIVVSSSESAYNEGSLLHEYGHHLDAVWHIAGVPELNGTPAWWNARGMSTLLSTHQVAFDYSLGWSHSIPEIFAEDYAYIQMPGYNYGIPWLTPPDDALKAALFAELGTPTSTLPAAKAEPLVLVRRGTLAPHGRRVVSFGLLGPGRHVILTANVAKPARNGRRARAEIVCDGNLVASQTFGHGLSKRVIDVPNLGPASCEARLVSTAAVKLTYTLQLSLAVENSTG